MDEFMTSNRAVLCGTPLSEPVFSHSARHESFYTFPIEVARLSGVSDTLNVLLRESLLPDVRPSRAGLLEVTGELRSFNNRSGEGNRLVITIFAQELAPPETAEWVNEIELSGAICKAPNYRTTPLGREICDLMLAVSRHYGRSDYIPCIVWGVNARRAALWSIGTSVHVIGRLQSREYTKNFETGAVRRTAYEVSVSDISAEEA